MRSLWSIACLVAGLSCAPHPSSTLGPLPPRRPAEPVSTVPVVKNKPRVPRRVTDVERARGLLWRFDAGAPVVAPPVVSDRGRLYVATTEGYVHALGADGGFRWSYTVEGAVLGAMAV